MIIVTNNEVLANHLLLMLRILLIIVANNEVLDNHLLLMLRILLIIVTNADHSAVGEDARLQAPVTPRLPQQHRVSSLYLKTTT